MHYKLAVNVALLVAFQVGANAQSDPLGLPALTDISAAQVRLVNLRCLMLNVLTLPQVTQLVSDIGNYIDAEEPAIESFATAAVNALSTFPATVVDGLEAQVTGFVGDIKNIVSQDAATPTALLPDIENFIESDAPAITAFANEVDSILSSLPTSVVASLEGDLDNIASGFLNIITSDLAAPTANATVASGSLVTSTSTANYTIPPSGTVSPSIAPFTGAAMPLVPAGSQVVMIGLTAAIGIMGIVSL